MEKEFINLTPENLDGKHLCYIIRSRKPHPEMEAKRRWLAGRLEEGYVLQKLDEKGAVFAEYAPLETTRILVTGDNYLYLYCPWAAEAYKGKGCGRALMEYYLADAGTKGKSSVCMLGAQKQKAWLSDQSLAERCDFQVVDTAAGGYELLVLPFDGTAPRPTDAARRGTIPERELTIYYGMQCPYIHTSPKQVKRFCGERDAPITLIPVDSLQRAKELPSVLNNQAVFHRGRLETVNLLDEAGLKRLLSK